MDRNQASKLTRELLNTHNLAEWSVLLNTDSAAKYVGLCSFKDKAIILNAIAVDIQPDEEIFDTIKHEIAHAIVGPNNGHNQTWADKAEELGARTTPCAHFALPEHVIDAIRSGKMVEMTFDTIKIPKYKVTRLQDKCPECGKVAIEKFSIQTADREGNSIKLITLECFHIIKKVIPKATAFDTMVSNDWKPEVKNCKHSWVKNQCEHCHEFKLYKFQVIGALNTEAALAMQKGFGIFDDMGLGKTVQGLAIPKFHKQYLPFLVVTKSAITYQWFKQIVRWCGPEYLSQIIRTSKDTLLPGLKSYIVPYDLLRRMDRTKIEKLGIKLVILDECQQIKNADSTRTQEVRKLVSNQECKVIALSGTPWKNRGSEFFPVLNMMDPVKFHSYQYFLDHHVDFYFEGAKKKMGGIRNIPKFKEYTASLLIRREYNEVMDEFPDINRMKLNVQLDELAQSTYDDAESDFVDWYNEAVIGGEEDKISSIEILAQLARARHITGLAKIPATLGFIEEFVEETDRKLVIGVHHKDVGVLMHQALINTSEASNKDWHELASELIKRGIKIFKYTSELNDRERFDMQEAFNKTSRAILIASTLACGEGVDLQTCADSILHERQWNPQNEDQFTPGRFRRIGQTSSVINITIPEAEGTVDEDLDGIVEKKRIMFHQGMNKGEMPSWNQSDIAKELAQRIVAKHKAKIKAKGGTIKKTNITAKAKIVRKPQPTMLEL
jgi:superfamily II DNA or RNA helicase